MHISERLKEIKILLASHPALSQSKRVVVCVCGLCSQAVPSSCPPLRALIHSFISGPIKVPRVNNFFGVVRELILEFINKAIHMEGLNSIKSLILHIISKKSGMLMPRP